MSCLARRVHDRISLETISSHPFSVSIVFLHLLIILLASTSFLRFVFRWTFVPLRNHVSFFFYRFFNDISSREKQRNTLRPLYQNTPNTLARKHASYSQTAQTSTSTSQSTHCALRRSGKNHDQCKDQDSAQGTGNEIRLFAQEMGHGHRSRNSHLHLHRRH